MGKRLFKDNVKTKKCIYGCCLNLIFGGFEQVLRLSNIVDIRPKLNFPENFFKGPKKVQLNNKGRYKIRNTREFCYLFKLQVN